MPNILYIYLLCNSILVKEDVSRRDGGRDYLDDNYVLGRGFWPDFGPLCHRTGAWYVRETWDGNWIHGGGYVPET